GASTAYCPCRAFSAGCFSIVVERPFASAPEGRKHRPVGKKIDGIVAPFAGGDHAAVHAKDLVELTPLEPDFSRAAARLSGPEFCPRSGAVARAEERYGFLDHCPR